MRILYWYNNVSPDIDHIRRALSRWVPTYLCIRLKTNITFFIFFMSGLWFICSFIVYSVERILFCETFSIVFSPVFRELIIING